MHSPFSPAAIDPDMLLLGYRTGIFPMADARDDPEVFWVEPRRRAILPLDGFHLSRSLAKTVRKERFEVTCNAAFAQVLELCAAPRADSADTWISRRIAATYLVMHARGLAHSIECWQADEMGDRTLVGGLYGVGFDRVFCGESMFSLATDASKVALAWLTAALRWAGCELLDCQFMTDHLGSLGAVSVPRDDYVSLLSSALGDGPGEFFALEPLVAASASGAGVPPGKVIAQLLGQTS
jgi:leucyl/phenylalanyl-tRNA--protein transferase